MEKSGKYSLIFIAALIIIPILFKAFMFQKKSTTSRRVREEFDLFCKKFDKTYKTFSERESRLKIFEKNLHELEAEQPTPGQLYTNGVTKFFDMTEEEFRSIYGGYRKDKIPIYKSKVPLLKQSFSSSPLEESWDWHKEGVTSPITYQGSCGACYAFATVS